MAFSVDMVDYTISMPPGDTGDLWVEVEWSAISDGDAVLFAIVDRRSGKDVLKKAADVHIGADADGNESAYAHIRLCNHDTRELRPGDYYWQLRLVTGPARDGQGNVIADDCSDHVISVFDELPVFKLLKRGARV